MDRERIMLRQVKNDIARAAIIPFLMVIVGWLPGCASIQPLTNISPEQAETLIRRKADDPHFVLLDVRTVKEFDTGHLAGALNIDFMSPDFTDKIGELDKSATYLVYCLMGGRSAQAMKLMREKGFKKVFNLEGGLKKWQAESRPIE